MKFKEGQRVLFIKDKDVLEGTIYFINIEKGIYHLNEVIDWTFTHFQRGAEAIFKNQGQAQKYLDGIVE